MTSDVIIRERCSCQKNTRAVSWWATGNIREQWLPQWRYTWRCACACVACLRKAVSQASNYRLKSELVPVFFIHITMKHFPLKDMFQSVAIGHEGRWIRTKLRYHVLKTQLRYHAQKNPFGCSTNSQGTAWYSQISTASMWHKLIQHKIWCPSVAILTSFDVKQLPCRLS